MDNYQTTFSYFQLAVVGSLDGWDGVTRNSWGVVTKMVGLR